jgi:hypothetical protein
MEPKQSTSTQAKPAADSNTQPLHSPPQHKESMLANLLLNIIIPTLILTKGSKEAYLGPTIGLLVALAFPLGYGLYDYWRSRKINIFSAIGLVSILLTGGISLLKLPPSYMAIKEATIPGLLGLATLISLYTRYPLVRTFLYNDKVMDVNKVHDALVQFNNVAAFEKSLSNATYMLAGSFFLSSALNYGLAKWVLVSPPGTEQYNAELGTMTALSIPVITIPSMLVFFAALFYLFRSITRLTHLHWEDILVQPEQKPGH